MDKIPLETSYNWGHDFSTLNFPGPYQVQIVNDNDVSIENKGVLIDKKTSFVLCCHIY